jgi:transposase
VTFEEERTRELVKGMPDLEEIMEPLLAARWRLRAKYSCEKVLMIAGA